MCISVLQAPKCRIHLLANSCWGSVDRWQRAVRNNPNRRLIDFRTYGFDGGKRWIRRHVSTSTEGRKGSNRILDENLSTGAVVDVNRTEISEIQKIQYCGIQQRLAENKDLSKILTVITFDIETTGLSRVKERIVEFASQDLAGGENSTFQTLVNPGRCIPNSHIHGIMDHMVRRPEVPRMEEMIPILLQYVRSRHEQDGYVLFVAHNGRSFDFPFLMNEFNRCSYEIPPNWLFLDTLPLAREMMKSSGSGKLQTGVSLEALGQFYEVPRVGSAHRALSDVRLLSFVFQRLTFDLKLSLPDLLLRSLTTWDLLNVKKKKSSA